MTLRGSLAVITLVLFAGPASAQSLGASFLQSSAGGQQPAPVPPPAPAPAPSILRAPAPTFPADARFGFINLQTIASQSAAGKAAALQLQTFQNAKLVEIQAKSSALKSLQDKQASSAVLAPAAAAQLQKDLDRAQMDLQYAQQMAQKDYDDLQRDVMAAFSDKVGPVVEAVRAERKLWAIWTIDETVAAVAPELDLSMEVVKRLDALK